MPDSEAPVGGASVVEAVEPTAVADAAPTTPALPRLHDLGNRCLPGHCVGREWRLEARGEALIAHQVVDWLPPERRGQARIVAAPRTMTQAEATAWLVSGGLEGLTGPVEKPSPLPDGFYLVVEGKHVSFRTFGTAQVVCAPSSFARLEETNFFCERGFADEPSPVPPTTTHSWVSLLPDWELPRRDGLASSAHFRRGEASGFERTTVLLRDPVAEVEQTVFERLVREKGAIQAGFVWTTIIRSEPLAQGFVLEGMSTSAYVDGEPEEPDFLVVRKTQGHWVMCELIHLEVPAHYEPALRFCKEGFR